MCLAPKAPHRPISQAFPRLFNERGRCSDPPPSSSRLPRRKVDVADAGDRRLPECRHSPGRAGSGNQAAIHASEGHVDHGRRASSTDASAGSAGSSTRLSGIDNSCYFFAVVSTAVCLQEKAACSSATLDGHSRAGDGFRAYCVPVSGL